MPTNKQQQLVPALRFPEFEGEWKKREFEELTVRSKEKYNPKKDQEFLPCIELESLSTETGILLSTFDSREQKSIKNRFYKGQVLYGKLRPYLKKYLIAPFDGVCSSEIWVFKTKKVLDIFLYYIIQSERFNTIANISTGTKMPRADWKYISSVPFTIPSLPEQQKIAHFLTLTDRKITLLQELVHQLQIFKKGLMEQLFSQQLRFLEENGEAFPNWEKKRLGEVFHRVKTKNKENNQNILTISAQLGLINQLDFFNKSVSARNVTGYYLLEKGDFAYNKSYSKGYPMGAIKRLNRYDKGVVSTLYICFRIKDNQTSPSFFEHYFEHTSINKELHTIAQEGARNHGLLNVSIVDFFELIRVDIPTLPEQKKIAHLLSSLDQQIQLIEAQVQARQEHKKGLLQQLLV